MANLNFDASSVDPNVTYEPLPADWYVGKIIASEMKPTSNGNGAYLELQIEVIEGEFSGRKVFDRLNLQNQNKVAEEIAYKTLSAICHAVDVIQVQDSQQLHGRPFEFKVKVKPADGMYDASNEVRGYRKAGNGAQAPAQQQQPAPMQGGPGSGFVQGQPGQPVQQQQQQQQQPQQGWQQPPAQQEQPAQQQQAPQQQWQQPANNQPNGPQGFNQQPAQQQQPQQQQQWQGDQGQQPQQGMATGHPTQGPAPSAGNNPEAPPWANQGQ